ncbi:MAG TPA: hypothetical protein EYP59_12370, partial [Thiotrichaceae bacterium]|nr:hypothetical protein [Thiotrichaceae bacterium]
SNMNSKQTLILVFADNQLAELAKQIEQINHVFSEATIIGGSTASEILGAEVKEESIALAIIQFEKSSVFSVKEKIENFNNSTDIAKSIGQKLLQQAHKIKQPLQGVFVLSDGLNVNGTHLVNGLNEALPNILITGGAMGDGSRFKTTFTLDQSVWATNEVVAVGFYGDSIELSHGSKGGWDVFGPERIVTKSTDNIVYEIDNKPALDLYKTYLGELATDLPSSGLLFPIAIINDDGTKIVRTLIGIDENTNAIIFVADVAEGSKVQLMKANFDRLIDGAYSAAELTNWGNLSGNQPTLSIAVSCVGRLLVLKGHIEEEVEATLEALPENTQQIGFYSYGEISPIANGTCSLHNQTMTLTTIREN